MSSVRINGRTEKLGSVSMSDEFVDWEIPTPEKANKMRRLLKEMGRSSLVLDRLKYGSMSLGHTAHASFIENKEFAGTREDSVHGVRFGQLILNGLDFREQPDFVAVKPYDDRADLYKEWAAHEYINSLFDRQVGYLNLGVYNDAKGVESTISQYDHDVITFDTSFWAGPDEPASALRPDVLQRHAILGMEGLGMFHGVRMTHGDAQAKNLAADRLGPRAVDLESADIFTQDEIDDESSFEKARNDISSFIYSMNQVEENRESIIAALQPDVAMKRIVNAYSEGVRQGRAALKGEYVPDFGRRNADFIHDSLRTAIK